LPVEAVPSDPVPKVLDLLLTEEPSRKRINNYRLPADALATLVSSTRSQEDREKDG